MNYAWFEKIAPHLAGSPLVLIGFVLLLAYGIHWQLMKSGLLRQVNQKDSSLIIRIILRYGFWLALTPLLAGFGLEAWKIYMEKEKTQTVNLDQLAEKVAAKVLEKMSSAEPGGQEARKAVAEAITAMPKVDVSDSRKEEALQALQRGDTKQAEAIFAEVLKTKEAQGRAANKEAAAAARHLGALAYMNNPKKALAAYQKAVELDPDNADGWNQLGNLLRRTGELAQAEAAYRKVLAVAGTKEAQAIATSNLGLVYFTRGDLAQAEEMHKKALVLDEALGNKKGMAANYGNLGLVYRTRGDLAQAEDMHKKSLALDEALGSKEGMAQGYGNLGNVYYTRGNLAQAEETHKKALALNEALGRKEGMAANYGNLGNVYSIRGDLDKAEEMHRKALSLNEALGSKGGMAVNYGNLGVVHETRGDLTQAEEMHKKALVLNEALGSKEGMAANYGNLGNVYEERGDLAQAEELWKKSLRLYQEIGHPNAKMVQQWLDDLAK